MNVIKNRSFQTLSIRITLMISLFLTGCATQLAPKYDSALFQGITDVNKQVMALFAWADTKTESSTFAKREPLYNATIGAVDALVLQSKARPELDNALVKKMNAYLASKGMRPLTGKTLPSTHALELLSAQLVKMKQVDKAKGLNATMIALFKNASIIAMDQALTYESFLNR